MLKITRDCCWLPFHSSPDLFRGSIEPRQKPNRNLFFQNKTRYYCLLWTILAKRKHLKDAIDASFKAVIDYIISVKQNKEILDLLHFKLSSSI